MVGKIKAVVQQKLNSICFEKYVREVERQKDSYRQWYLRNEGWKTERLPKGKGCPLIAYQRLTAGCALPDLPADSEPVVFADARGTLEEAALGAVEACFSQKPYVQLAYGDEDELSGEGRRHSPWFKPCWSPDTLESFQYFGHVFAVRAKWLATLSQAEWDGCMTGDFEANVYRLLLCLTAKIAGKEGIRANDTQKAIAGMERVLIHMPEGLPDAEPETAEEAQSEEAAMKAAAGPVPDLISVIIPSKDNPQVLETCLRSLQEKTETGGKISREIVVVDNGSGPANRKTLEALAQELDFQYLYEPMPFNFSKMCNLGAEKSKGSYLLFLNDDMEIIQPDWLLRLWEKARLPHVGAVGAKLLYPQSGLIQHIGITNIQVGPVHKLLKQPDEKCYYHGQNRHVYDMLGVTAACLLVARSKYEETGGFYEGMAVAYNDVDFCFSLYERGYYNVECCNVILYHHESLSRGDDNLSDEKWLRLLREKDILYDRHPALKGKDPFYSANLAAHSNLYLSNFMYAFEKRDYYTELKRRKKPLPPEWENGCLIVNVEHAREEKKLEFTERDDVLWVEGWSYVLGRDNCRYERELLLTREDGLCFCLKLLSRYRKDVEAILPEQKNVALAGFVCRIPKKELPPGRYAIAMLAKDRCSQQKLCAKTEVFLDNSGRT